MLDYAAARRNMVEGQVRTNDVTDIRIQQAMARIPRERFVPRGKRSLAYMDECLELAPGRVLMEPRCFAKLLQAAEIENDDVVLDIGCATGYSSAVIAALANAVVGLEEDETLVALASEKFADLDVDNAAIVNGPLAHGYASQGPYDVIFLNGGAEYIPDMLFDQLKEDGRLAVVLMDGAAGRAHIFMKSGGETDNTISDRIVFDAALPVLPGFERIEDFSF